jgi:hypothetical protein
LAVRLEAEFLAMRKLGEGLPRQLRCLGELRFEIAQPPPCFELEGLDLA